MPRILIIDDEAPIRRVLREIAPDAVVAHSRVPAWLFVWANRTLGLKWITFAHGANSISRYSRIMTAGDLTVTPSRYIADYLKDAYAIPEEKLRVIPERYSFAGTFRKTGFRGTSVGCDTGLATSVVLLADFQSDRSWL